MNKKLAGSALLQFPELVEEIIDAVVNAVDIPVTLKIRTGWDPDNRNGVEIARIAERYGIASLAVHGRTRACMYKGEAEYATIRDIKRSVSIPVVANGDITSPEKAKQVLDYTGADAIMIGRAAQGRPWIFREIDHYLRTGEHMQPPAIAEVRSILMEHLTNLHAFYGEPMGARIARKHVSWYLQTHDSDGQFRRVFNALDNSEAQVVALEQYFKTLAAN